MRNKKIAAASSFLAILSGTLWFVGISGWCCSITGAAILSFLGVVSFSGFLFYQSKFFLAAAFIFGSLAIFSYLRYRQGKNCQIKK